MFDKVIDLDKIPESRPFGTYRHWLIWKIENMLVGDLVTLPIFSAFQITRLDSCIIFKNSSTGAIFASVSAIDIVLALETQNFAVQKPALKRTVDAFKATQLQLQGHSVTDIADLMECSRGKILRYLALTG